MKVMRDTVVIVPTYNNPKTIKHVTFDVLEHGYELIIIDDGSDEAIESLFAENEKEHIHFLRHDVNQGKGIAIINGVSKAKELGFSFAVSMDGDGQHLASEVQKLL